MNLIKCGACGNVLKGFNDDCLECLKKEQERKK